MRQGPDEEGEKCGSLGTNLLSLDHHAFPLVSQQHELRLSGQKSYFFMEHVGGKSSVLLFLIRLNIPTDLVSAFPSLTLPGKQILHLVTPERCELWLRAWL